MTITLVDQETKPILIDDLTWREFKIVTQLIERPGVRLSFLDGVLEIRQKPGKKHETIKKRIAALLEIYLEFIGLDFTPTGSMTLESESGQVKREADESYELGTNRERPDLVIEVTVSSGGINKLEAYKRLKIPEVWFWEDGQLSLYSLRDQEYEAVPEPRLLPHLDVALLMRCINFPNHTQALREFRQEINK
ncbi:MAG: Uma2 family endonuclease [Aphanothece sp. CMT-3BRIN-NPC111]|jgi:Uma2 family endonuclease|nr:Uma2 family endonuclease [Aphanothece sp. CMT-3BRIN-NPC111]